MLAPNLTIMERINKEASALAIEGYTPRFIMLGAAEYNKLKFELDALVGRALQHVLCIDTSVGELKIVRKLRTPSYFEFGE